MEHFKKKHHKICYITSEFNSSRGGAALAERGWASPRPRFPRSQRAQRTEVGHHCITTQHLWDRLRAKYEHRGDSAPKGPETARVSRIYGPWEGCRIAFLLL